MPDTYMLQAQDGHNRARTQITLTHIVPGQPQTANLTFLGKGTVSGLVRDGTGMIQANTPVSIQSTGAFSNTWSVTTDANGRYVAPNIFVGEISVTIKNPLTKVIGAAAGRLLAEGDQLKLDVALTATGILRGRVFKADGSPASGPLTVKLMMWGTLLETSKISAGNEYSFDLAPLSPLTVQASTDATGDSGMASTTLTSANETRNLDVRLLGQGAVRVKVVDDAGQAVVGAKVLVHSSSAFPSDLTLQSDSNGLALAQPVFNGDFVVTASKAAVLGQITGSASGTVVNNGTAEAVVTLTARTFGKLAGTVFAADGITPLPGMLVSIRPEPYPGAYSLLTDVNGKYQSPDLESGAIYTATVRRSSTDRARAQAFGLQITQPGQVLTRNLQVLGAGTVTGTVRLADGKPASGITIHFSSPDPLFGAAGKTSTNLDGSYQLPDMPSGNFTLRAEDRSRTLRAEAEGRIRFDGDVATIDLNMVDNAVAMPYTLYDANAMPFDLAGDGSVVNGAGGIFTGLGPDARGMRLDILVGGVPVPFKNGDGTVGRLSLDKQQIEVDEAHASGLSVTRRIYVPKTGYFARYLELLENKGSVPITVDVRVTSNHSESNGNPRVVDSSSGDNSLSSGDPATADTWVVVDDQQDADPFTAHSEPATGHLFDGKPGGKRTDAASYGLVGQTGKLVWQWNSITIPAGQRVGLMHFAFNQLGRDRAREAALRLAQMPPEALAELSEQDKAIVANFTLPASSALAPLPQVDAASITGSVLAGDGITPIALASIHFKSKHPLFGRDFYTSSDVAGKYTFTAKPDGTNAALPLPHFGFDIAASHPQTRANTAAAISEFPPASDTVVKDLVFNGTGVLRGSVARADGTPVAGVDISFRPENGQTIQSSSDGRFLFTGMPPQEYVLAARKWHPQQAIVSDCCGVEGSAKATVFASATSVVDITLEQVGTVVGIVRAANGDPVVGASLRLIDSLGRLARISVTDTAGRYRFSDVKLGATRITAVDPVSGSQGKADTTVARDGEAVADIALKGFGTVSVQVNYARGTPVAGAEVGNLTGPGGCKSDSVGRCSFSIPVGSYRFAAAPPGTLLQNQNGGFNPLNGYAETTLAGNGETASVTIALQPFGAIRGMIVRPDGSTLAGGFPYSVKLQNGAVNAPVYGNSNAVGEFEMDYLAPGSYLVTAYDAAQNRFADTDAVLATDGEVSTVRLVLENNRILLPADLSDANRFRFDIQNDGSLGSGSGDFQGAARLEVNGQAFSGDATGLLEAGKRQIAISQEGTVGGLKVTRKVYVPVGGYFARYLDVFENPGPGPLQLRAKVTTGYQTAQLIDSSSKGQSVSEADQWLVLDDGQDGDPLIAPQQPSTAHVHGQTGARLAPELVRLNQASGGTQLEQRWSTTLAPGARLALMHFVVQQINRQGAVASAQRLAQLPPEAIESLTPTEVAAIANFSVPADGRSSVPSLPALTGRVSGQVMEGDGVTPVNGVSVVFQSPPPSSTGCGACVQIPFAATCLAPGSAAWSRAPFRIPIPKKWWSAATACRARWAARRFRCRSAAKFAC